MKLRKSWWKKLLVAWVVLWIIFCFGVYWFMSSFAVEKRKESLASMCDERARMLQDQFNVSMNHIQAMSIFPLLIMASIHLLLISLVLKSTCIRREPPMSIR